MCSFIFLISNNNIDKNFLKIHNYPFIEEQKIGFVPQKTLFSLRERIEYRLRNMLGLNKPNG